MNKKGFTTIELITSFSIASVIMLVLFNVIIIMKDNMSDINTKTNMLVAKDNLSYNINKRLKEKELTSLSMCEDGVKCYLFTYSDSTTDKLVYNIDSITFNNYTFEITDGITVDAPTITEHYDTMTSTTYNGYIIINIPITINNKDYSIKTVKHINADNVYVDLGNYYRDTGGNIYTKVEYLESTGRQYINTQYTVNELTEIDTSFISYPGGQNGTAWCGVFGARQAGFQNNYKSFGLFVAYSSSSLALNYGNVDTSNIAGIGSLNKSRLYNIGTKFYYNDIEFREFENKPVSFENPMYLFALNNSNTPRYSHTRLYYFKIRENGDLIRDYIPVVDSNNVGCLFDKIEKKCYYNQGSGRLLLPDEEHIKNIGNEYTEVNYVRSNDLQYIDTNYALWKDNNWKIEVKYELEKHQNYNVLFGFLNEISSSNKVWSDSSGNLFLKAGVQVNLSSLEINQPYTLVVDNTQDEMYNYVNGELINTSNKSNTSSPNTLGLAHMLGNGYLYGKIYYLKFWSDGNLVRDYIPVVDKDGIPCLLDKVESKCYYSFSGNEFLYG